MSKSFMAQLPYIGSTSTLGWKDDTTAQAYMEHILQRARILLPRRGWRVGTIKEFYPRGAALLGLNVNAGSEVCVRFRVPGMRNEFLPFHEVLCTALHEFTHCVHSRHDRAFWNLYYDLVKECEALEVQMIAEGKPLYPVQTYTPISSTAITSSTSPRATSGSRSTPSTLSRFGGTGGATGVGGSSGGGTVLRRGVGSKTMTVKRPSSAQPSSTAVVKSSPADGVFPGEGHRLGSEPGLRQYDTTQSSTPTRDALRRILSAAAARRLLQSTSINTPSSPAAPTTKNIANGELVITEEVPETSPELDPRLAGCTPEEIPDEVPLTQFAVEDSWRCARCGFCNEAGVHGCQFCADEEDALAPLEEERAEAEKVPTAAEPPVKKERLDATTSVVAVQSVHHGTTKDDAFDVDNDDD